MIINMTEAVKPRYDKNNVDSIVSYAKKLVDQTLREAMHQDVDFQEVY